MHKQETPETTQYRRSSRFQNPGTKKKKLISPPKLLSLLQPPILLISPLVHIIL